MYEERGHCRGVARLEPVARQVPVIDDDIE